MGACITTEARPKVSGSAAELVEQLQGPKELVKDEGTALFVGFADVKTEGFVDIADCKNFKIEQLVCKVCLTIEGRPPAPEQVSHPALVSAKKSVKYLYKHLEAGENYLVDRMTTEGRPRTPGPLHMVAEAVKTLTANKREVNFNIVAKVQVRKEREPNVKVEISKDGLRELESIAQELSPRDAKQHVENALCMKILKWASVNKWRLLSSEDIQKAKGTAKYHENQKDWGDTVPGVNAYIRRRMDYTYFVQVSLERVIWQDSLINFELFPSSCRDRKRTGKFSLPWVVYSAGGMGAGKGYVKKWLDAQGYLPAKRCVGVDPDQIRKCLPEWDQLSTDLPQEAGYLTQNEATNIGDIVAKKALANRFCVFIDGSLRDTNWYRDNEFPLYRKLFPGIRIMILHVRADPEDECVRRAIERAKTEGRAVPEEQVRKSLTDSERSVQELAKEADFVIRIINRTGQEPELQPVSQSEDDGINPSPKVLERGGGWKLLGDCFKPLDKSRTEYDGKGYLSKATLEAAIQQGVLTQRVVDSMEMQNKDGIISADELALARRRALEWGDTHDELNDKDSTDEDTL
mmetsp:Transcript_113940/g.221261  ORF Transcript_113940/g.221261 Transcript_113940/m.221261 type:complete len:575 (-) Transcript_113940:44-1768(-)